MTRLTFGLMVLLAGCAKPQLVLHEPGDPALVRKLGVSGQEWLTLQTQLTGHLGKQDPADLRVIHWGRSKVTGDIEVWCAHTAPTSPKNSGPVFFFRRFAEEWHMVTAEVSEWSDP
jgi:hypothetical protein